MRPTNINPRRGLYRSRSGVILGVCKGIAEYFDFSVFWARMITVVLLFVTGLWPLVGIYIVAALLMKPEPMIPIETEAEKEFYDSYTHSRHSAAQRLKRRYQNLERRIRRMEHVVTTPEFNWEKRFDR
jgi:phage shock protein C